MVPLGTILSMETSLSQKKICLVTGGCGFIGSHLVELLLRKGYVVHVLDDMSTGSRSNLDHVSSNTNLQIFEGSILDSVSIDLAIEGCTYVFHLAALADIVPSVVEPERYFSVNLVGTFNVLQASRRANIKKIIYAASSSCYGIPDSYPTSETAEIRPQYPYAFTKWSAEQLVMHWNAVYQVPAVSLRLFNVYGPRSRTSGAYGAVFGVFLAQKLNGKPMTVVGDGTQSRDFTFVRDVVRAFLAAAENPVSNEIFNVGSEGTYSISSLVKLLGGDVVFIPKRPGEPELTFADTSKIQNELTWKPEVSFEDGVREMLESIEYWKNAPVWEPESIAAATSDWFKYLSDK